MENEEFRLGSYMNKGSYGRRVRVTFVKRNFLRDIIRNRLLNYFIPV